mgnify:CR=1 FL=1
MGEPSARRMMIGPMGNVSRDLLDATRHAGAHEVMIGRIVVSLFAIESSVVFFQSRAE